MNKFLDKASKAYYEGNPIISDATYDLLFATYGSGQVGYSVTDGLPHYYRMYSLQKCFDLADAPISISSAVATPKLDGAAVSLLYVEKNLTQALTRGDGNLGLAITKKLSYLVPTSITEPGVVQITGEVVAPRDIPNSRNFVSGSLNLKNMDQFLRRKDSLWFVAYNIEPSTRETYLEDLNYLSSGGFFTPVSLPEGVEFPTDGEVYRINNNNKFRQLGFTSHHPRGAFALKKQQEGKITTLIDIEWQVGRTGVVSPVAILDPVEINDAIISRATLHNPGHIKKLGLELGCQVEVVRSGEIIPMIVRRI